MKKKSNLKIIISIILVIVIAIIVTTWSNGTIKRTTDKNNKNDLSIIKTIPKKIDWSNYQTKDINLKDNLTITESGIYNLTGTLKNGYIKINTKDNVKLVLNDVTIKNSNGPAIYVENAKNLVIETMPNTKNTLEDSTSYTGFEEEVNSTIYSKDTLILDGTGTLSIKANHKDGIGSKDDLQIINGTYIINAEDDGIRGKDSVYIKDGNFIINTSGDGIKSTNTTDTNKGYIEIENGTFDITSKSDAIQSETKLTIINGNYEITTGGGSKNKINRNNLENWQSKPKDTTPSAKGLKANEIIIQNGNFTLNTSDDAIHANDIATIQNGKYQITSGDDAIHADNKIDILEGTINIKESYEGIETTQLNIENGKIKIIASDDGINLANENDKIISNKPTKNDKNQKENILTINGGNIYINATGDGIDINGDGTMNNGTVIIDGPTKNDGSIDYKQKFTINGGTIIAGGGKQMAEGFSDDSKQNIVIIFLKYTKNDIQTISIKDGEKVIAKYNPSKNYEFIQFSTPKLEMNRKYTIDINNKIYNTFTISSTITIIRDNIEI